MLFIININCDTNRKVYIMLDGDDKIQRLYDIANENFQNLYFRDTYLYPEKKVKDYFPYNIPKVYIYDKPVDHDLYKIHKLESDTNLKFERNIFIIGLYIFGLFVVTKIAGSIV